MDLVDAALAHTPDAPFVTPENKVGPLKPTQHHGRRLLYGVVLAGSTLEDPISTVTLGTLRLSLRSTLTVADEVQDDLHLLGEAQWFDLDGFVPAVGWTFVSLHRNLEEHLRTRKRLMKSLQP